MTARNDFLETMLRFVDCEARSIGAEGYAALAAPGSPVASLLSIALTLVIAVIGYQMLLGFVPTIRDAVLAVVKVGIVLVLATSWPAYQVLVYDTAVLGPAELFQSIGGAAGLPGAGGGMTARLVAVDDALGAMTLFGAGAPPIGEPPQALGPFGGFDAFALGSARILFLLGVIGAFAAVRLITGLALALAPLFALFLLFETTRGLFEGWVRVLLGAVLGTFGVTLMLGIELALLEPWLIDLLAARSSRIALPNAPAELFSVTFIFCLALIAVIGAAIRLAMNFTLPRIWPRRISQGPGAELSIGTERPLGSAQHSDNEERSRALILADAIASSQRREGASASVGALVGGRMEAGPPDRPAIDPIAQPLGQTFRRRTMTRVSAGALKREQRG
ncbi:type IV secretion system protein [Sphingomonas sp. CJ99]